MRSGRNINRITCWANLISKNYIFSFYSDALCKLVNGLASLVSWIVCLKISCKDKSIELLSSDWGPHSQGPIPRWWGNLNHQWHKVETNLSKTIICCTLQAKLIPQFDWSLYLTKDQTRTLTLYMVILCTLRFNQVLNLRVFLEGWKGSKLHISFITVSDELKGLGH